jgi:hypothetical protein
MTDPHTTADRSLTLLEVDCVFTRAFDRWFCAIARRIPFWTLGVLLILSLFSRLWLMFGN